MNNVLEKRLNKSININNESTKNDIQENKEKEKISFLKLAQYFIIYSIIGFIIETFFGMMTEGVIESRRNFLYGPFSCIYGAGGVLMILTLSRLAPKRHTLFWCGVIVGTVLEYSISLFGELIYNVKWWDYSHMPFNINGRVCLAFSIIWGLLAVYYISYFHPRMDRFLQKINATVLKVITIIMLIVFIINFIITSFALEVFYTRTVEKFDLEIKDTSQLLDNYDMWCENETFKYVTDTFFSDEKMVKTFPNLRMELKDGTLLCINTLFPEIQPYYIKVFDTNN